MKSLEVLILSGGFGRRLATITQDVPKPMAPVQDRPFLEYLVNYIKSFGFHHICLLTGHRADVIKDYFGDGSRHGVHIRYSHEETPLGTGGAIFQAMNSSQADEFLIFNGDGLFTTDLKLFIEQAQAPLTLALKYSNEMDRYGSVVIDDNYQVRSFREKQAGLTDGYINAGIYYATKDLLKEFSKQVFSIETDFFEQRASTGQVMFGLPCAGRSIDIGIPESFRQAQDCIPRWVVEQPRPALFLDRDGVIIEHKDYLYKVDEAKLISPVIQLIRQAREHNWLIFVVTNQSGIGRGYFKAEACHTLHQHLAMDLDHQGATVDQWILCPYHSQAVLPEYKKESLLRKPQPGMALHCADKYAVDIKNSYMVGDQYTDQLLLPGLKTILIKPQADRAQLHPTTQVVEDPTQLLRWFIANVFGERKNSMADLHQ